MSMAWRHILRMRESCIIHDPNLTHFRFSAKITRRMVSIPFPRNASSFRRSTICVPLLMDRDSSATPHQTVSPRGP